MSEVFPDPFSISFLPKDLITVQKHELVEPEFVQRKLATLDKGRHSVKNTKKIINLIRYHTSAAVFDRHTFIEKNVPAVGYLLSS